MIPGLGIPLFVLLTALSTYYGGALAGLAALGRLEKEDERPAGPPALTAFILRDATSAMAAWVVAGFFCGLASVLCLASVAASLLVPRWPVFATQAAALVCTTVAILLGLVLWKRLAEESPRGYCVTAAALVLPVYLLLYPLRRPLGNALARLYPPSALRAGVLFTEDVEAHENGNGPRLLDRDEREMIERVFLLGETVVREIMVPRIDMVAVEESTSVADFVKLVREKRHSRLPVYRDNVDNIIGFLHIKDVIAHVDRLGQTKLHDLLRPAYFVPETKRADDLLSEMRARRMHLAIVVDEYGGTAGIVTLEDVIEEVVGEIQDESDKEQPLVSRLADGSFRVDAKVDLDDLNERLRVALPAGDYDTLGGYLYGLAGKIPAAGDRFRGSGLEFVIGGVRGKRITKVIVRPLPARTVDGSGGGDPECGAGS
ncbi:MAG: hemolysin family protein [Candidatus Krumholzibacteriia bacterium]